MTFEPTRPGNPNGLTIYQHVFPRSAIARFCDAKGEVRVQSLRASRPRSKVDKADVFCAQRAWDQATETYKTRREEDDYRKLADAVVSGDIKTLSPEHDQVASLFIALWTARHLARSRPSGDIELKGVTDPALSQEQEENLEANGVTFTRDGIMPSRIFAGMTIRFRIDHEFEQLRGKHWGIVRSTHGEFLVPDNSMHVGWIPVSPNVSLALESDDVTLPVGLVGFANRQALSQAREYYFARDLDRCPILRRSIPLAPRDMWWPSVAKFGRS